MLTQEILHKIKQSVQEVIPNLPEEKIIPSNSLKDLGANSIDRAEIIMLTIRSLNLKVSLMAFANAKTIGDLIAILQREINLVGCV